MLNFLLLFKYFMELILITQNSDHAVGSIGQAQIPSPNLVTRLVITIVQAQLFRFLEFGMTIQSY